jgi:hypothetical protein
VCIPFGVRVSFVAPFLIWSCPGRVLVLLWFCFGSVRVLVLVLVLFLGLFSLGGLGPFLILYWFRSCPLGLCSSSSSVRVLVWFRTGSVLVPFLIQFCSPVLVLSSCRYI